jgi:glycosyltransferase involved in cell wall biosynthesis
MIVGVDASNIRTGGGLTHLVALLGAAEPGELGIAEVVVFGSRATLERLPRRPWLVPVHEPWLDRPLPWRLAWQQLRLPRRVAGHCDVVFVPGGNAPRLGPPVVTMSRNMLPFEMPELRRYGLSPTALRLLLLRFGQARTFRRADGLVFLTRYAQDAVLRAAPTRARTAIIPHGVDEAFRRKPAPARALEEGGAARPLRVLYVSIVDLYKHQWHVAEAVARLRAAGLPVAAEFVGPVYPGAERRFRGALAALDPRGEFLRYAGPASREVLPGLYASADVFAFASSCENMPNILLEAMAAGLPIACSQRGPMPEILGDAGVYFDPERPDEIARALEALLRDAPLRARCAELAYARALAYSWERCARETLSFVAEVARFAATSPRRA